MAGVTGSIELSPGSLQIVRRIFKVRWSSVKHFQREKRLGLSCYFGWTSRPSSGDLLKNRKVVTIQIEQTISSWKSDTNVTLKTQMGQ